MSGSFGAGNGDFYLIKTNNLGDTSWTKTYGGNLNDIAYSVRQTSDSGYVIAGTTFSFGVGGSDFYFVKTNAVGDTIWTKTFGFNGQENGFSVLQTNDGGYLVAGNTDSIPTSSILLVKTNSLGIVSWSKILGIPNSDNVARCIMKKSSGYLVGGFTNGAGSGGYDIFLLRINAAEIHYGLKPMVEQEMKNHIQYHKLQMEDMELRVAPLVLEQGLLTSI